MSLKQLVYVSDAPFETSDQTIENILATSRKNNPPNDITGMLIYSNGVFIQALEGEAPIVDRLYATISDDLRHQNVHIISDRISSSESSRIGPWPIYRQRLRTWLIAPAWMVP